jgi:hypothetical protein
MMLILIRLARFFVSFKRHTILESIRADLEMSRERKIRNLENKLRICKVVLEARA